MPVAASKAVARPLERGREGGPHRGPQRGDGLAQLREPLLELLAHRVHHACGALGRGGDQSPRALELHHGHGQAVAEGVVHLARDALALLGDG